MFQSKILDAYVSRTEKLDELIARMYVHGMSTRDIEATFADVLSCAFYLFIRADRIWTERVRSIA